jgi:hypothetical protein
MHLEVSLYTKIMPGDNRGEAESGMGNSPIQEPGQPCLRARDVPTNQTNEGRDRGSEVQPVWSIP